MTSIPIPPDLDAIIAATAAEVLALLAPDVVRIRWSRGGDWSGEPSVFFRVLLADDVSGLLLMATSTRVEREISSRLDPWAPLFHFLIYYNYRSASEQARMKCLEWE